MRVGITGVASDLGNLLLPRLLANPHVSTVVAFDVSRPTHDDCEYVNIDLTRPDGAAELSRAFAESKIDALYHLAFVNSRVHGATFAHELEIIGTLHVLAAAGEIGISRLIVPSLTTLYGATAHGPTWLTEQHPLHGCHGSRFITDRVDVEKHVRQWSARHPGSHTVTLRFAPIIGPQSDNPLTRLLKSKIVPTVMGFDPLWQLLHEDDAGRALEQALTTRHSGAFNLAATEPVPLSRLIRQAGARQLPLPEVGWKVAVQLRESLGMTATPQSLMQLLKFSCLADTSRARTELNFNPMYSTAEALRSFAEGGR